MYGNFEDRHCQNQEAESECQNSPQELRNRLHGRHRLNQKSRPGQETASSWPASHRNVSPACRDSAVSRSTVLEVRDRRSTGPDRTRRTKRAPSVFYPCSDARPGLPSPDPAPPQSSVGNSVHNLLISCSQSVYNIPPQLSSVHILKSCQHLFNKHEQLFTFTFYPFVVYWICSGVVEVSSL